MIKFSSLKSFQRTRIDPKFFKGLTAPKTNHIYVNNKPLQSFINALEAKKMESRTTTTTPVDERNIEIKARVGSDEEFEKRVDIAKKLTNSSGELIVQRDVFFNSQSGRLKLRYLQPPAKSQLVYYDRPDVAGPKLSKFNKIEVDEPEVLEKMLALSNGSKGVVAKKRYLFLYERTRIHLDKVDNLGNFMEFEVCLLPEQTIEEGQKVADKLIKEFGIKEGDLMTGAYFDELKT